MSTVLEPALEELAAVPSAPAGPGARFTREEFRAFTDREIVPIAGDCDREARTPPELVRKFAEAGYLGTFLPKSIGGAEMDMATFGVMNEEVGRGCSAIRSLLTVHAMVSVALQRWGSREQKEQWLPRLARGQAVGAFALSEPEVGSDAAAIATTAVLDGDQYVVDGQKRWTTYGQIAGVFLVIARSEGKPLALLVERGTPGFHIEPQHGILGTRAAMLATLRFDGCRVPRTARVGGPGFGLGVALSALEVGRYSVATGAVGLLQACLEASIRYSTERQQFGAPLSKHQLVRRMITDMAADVRAARYLCERAGQMYDADPHSPATRQEIFIAKYFASTAAGRGALSAVQIHGGNGMTDAYPVERYLRDSRVLEIIEGSTQIMQITIAKHEIESYLGPAAPGAGGGIRD